MREVEVPLPTHSSRSSGAWSPERTVNPEIQRAYGRWLGHDQARRWQAAGFGMEGDRKEKRRQA